jgi:hypothetical protein
MMERRSVAAFFQRLGQQLERIGESLHQFIVELSVAFWITRAEC